ncbi:hypothetical protein BGZ73_000393 [Actinomortierella ambigua]|nr:hypothetical protein BGZ73_000393 [Actinomortierella ambigua]
MSAIPETHVDALNQQEAVDTHKRQQQHDSQEAARAPTEEVADALQVSEPTSAASNDEAEQQDEDHLRSATAVPTIEEPAAVAEATAAIQTLSLQPPQLSPAAIVGASSPRSPVSPSRYTIDDDDDDYYEDGFEGGQLTILQGPGQQGTGAGGASAAPKEAPVFDIHAELDFVKARLETIAQDLSDPRINEERVALQEQLQKATENYIASQEELAAKQQQLSNNMHNEGVRVVLESQVDFLTEETKSKERQWSATKQVYHREFGELMDSPRKMSSVRAKTEVDIRQLQEQIAHLQRQLDTVAARRRQMMADAEEHRRRYADAGMDD